jgi:hypothetical protein
MCTVNTITDRKEILTASREELVSYLTNWGFQCYDHETNDELRDAALENWDTENAD